MRTVVNLLGKKFGKLTVICFDEDSKKKGTKYRWFCKCDCGNLVSVINSNLKRGHVSSCGCLKKEAHRKAPQEAARNIVIRTYKANAKKRKVSWNLSDTEVIELCSRSCFYCGSEPSNISKSLTDTFIYNGIDRVDNSKGYNIRNCVPCCYKCNALKKDFSINNMKKSLEFLGYSIIRVDDAL